MHQDQAIDSRGRGTPRRSLGLRQTFSGHVGRILKEIDRSELRAINLAGAAISNALCGNHRVYFFGTGHAQIPALEQFYRAGGPVNIRPILPAALSLNDDASGSSAREKQEERVEKILSDYPVQLGDVSVVFSNSGINGVPVEYARRARQAGATVVGVTSRAHSASQSSRHSKGYKLADVSDIVIDNHGVVGDAGVTLPSGASCAGTSTIAFAYISHLMMLAAHEAALRRCLEIPVWVSANVAGGGENNAKYLKTLKGQILHL